MGVSDEMVRQVMAELGRRGGTARANALTPKERHQIALKASKAAAAARKKKAKAKKEQE